VEDRLRQWVNVLAVVITIAINGLATSLPLNGRTAGEIADLFQIYFVPAGYAFAIWGPIYLGLTAFAVYQALPSQRENARLRRVGYSFTLSCMANVSWLFLWHYGLYPLSLLAMLALLLLLITVYLRLGIGRATVSAGESWLVHIPFSIYLGWITVATIANVSSVLYYVNWDGWGVSPEAWTVIMLLAATGIASAVSLTRGDIAYMLVIIWAFAAIAVKHAGTPMVTTAAWVVTVLGALILLVGARIRHAKRETAAARQAA
jgi:benzodiazapine receptor